MASGETSAKAGRGGIVGGFVLFVIALLIVLIGIPIAHVAAIHPSDSTGDSSSHVTPRSSEQDRARDNTVVVWIFAGAAVALGITSIAVGTRDRRRAEAQADAKEEADPTDPPPLSP